MYIVEIKFELDQEILFDIALQIIMRFLSLKTLFVIVEHYKF